MDPAGAGDIAGLAYEGLHACLSSPASAACPGDTDRRSGPEKLPVGGALWSVSLRNFDQTFSQSYSGRQRHTIHGLKSSTKIIIIKVSTRTSSILWECAVFIPGRPSEE